MPRASRTRPRSERRHAGRASHPGSPESTRPWRPPSPFCRAARKPAPRLLPTIAAELAPALADVATIAPHIVGRGGSRGQRGQEAARHHERGQSHAGFPVVSDRDCLINLTPNAVAAFTEVSAARHAGQGRTKSFLVGKAATAETRRPRPSDRRRVQPVTRSSSSTSRRKKPRLIVRGDRAGAVPSRKSLLNQRVARP